MILIKSILLKLHQLYYNRIYGRIDITDLCHEYHDSNIRTA